MTAARFVAFWSEGEDSFIEDPPNATLFFLENKNMADAVVVLRVQCLAGEGLSYEKDVLEGEIPA